MTGQPWSARRSTPLGTADREGQFDSDGVAGIRQRVSTGSAISQKQARTRPGMEILGCEENQLLAKEIRGRLSVNYKCSGFLR